MMFSLSANWESWWNWQLPVRDFGSLIVVLPLEEPSSWGLQAKPYIPEPPHHRLLKIISRWIECGGLDLELNSNSLGLSLTLYASRSAGGGLDTTAQIHWRLRNVYWSEVWVFFALLKYTSDDCLKQFKPDHLQNPSVKPSSPCTDIAFPYFAHLFFIVLYSMHFVNYSALSVKLLHK